MGNPETKPTLGYDIVQTQLNERQLKYEHGPHRKTGLTQVLANVGNNGCFTRYFSRILFVSYLFLNIISITKLTK